MPTLQEIQDIIKERARFYNVPENIALNMAKTESGFNPAAEGPMTKKHGTAKGLYQFIDSTAKGMGLDDPYDPYKSADAAMKMLSENASKLNGRYDLAVAAHQAGLPAVQKNMAIPGGGDQNMTTSKYVQSIMGGTSGIAQMPQGDMSAAAIEEPKQQAGIFAGKGKITLDKYRKIFPAYDEIDDETLSKAVHKKYYPKVDYDTFAKAFNGPLTPEEVKPVTFEDSFNLPKYTPGPEHKETSKYGRITSWLLGAPYGLLDQIGSRFKQDAISAQHWAKRDIEFTPYGEGGALPLMPSGKPVPGMPGVFGGVKFLPDKEDIAKAKEELKTPVVQKIAYKIGKAIADDTIDLARIPKDIRESSWFKVLVVGGQLTEQAIAFYAASAIMPGSLGYKIPGMYGAKASFMSLKQAAQLAAPLSVYWTSAAQETASMFDRGALKDIPEETRVEAAMAAETLGLWDVVGMVPFLGVVGKIGGPTALKGIVGAIVKRAGKYPRTTAGVLGAAEEASTEMMQDWGENRIARKYYGELVDQYASSMESGKIAGLSGAIFGILLKSLQIAGGKNLDVKNALLDKTIKEAEAKGLLEQTPQEAKLEQLYANVEDLANLTTGPAGEVEAAAQAREELEMYNYNRKKVGLPPVEEIPYEPTRQKYGVMEEQEQPAPFTQAEQPKPAPLTSPPIPTGEETKTTGAKTEVLPQAPVEREVPQLTKDIRASRAAKATKELRIRINLMKRTDPQLGNEYEEWLDDLERQNGPYEMEEPTDAQDVREDEGQVQERGSERQVGQGEGGEDLQQPASEGAGGEKGTKGLEVIEQAEGKSDADVTEWRRKWKKPETKPAAEREISGDAPKHMSALMIGQAARDIKLKRKSVKDEGYARAWVEDTSNEPLSFNWTFETLGMDELTDIDSFREQILSGKVNLSKLQKALESFASGRSEVSNENLEAGDVLPGRVVQGGTKLHSFNPLAIEQGESQQSPFVQSSNIAAKQDKTEWTPTGTVDLYSWGGPLALGWKKAEEQGRVFNGPGGRRMFEIDDSKAIIRGNFISLQPGQTAKLGDVLDHKELFKQYPQLRDVNITRNPDQYDPGRRSQGWYDKDTNTINITPYGKDQFETIIHEIAHATQKIENWPGGGNEAKGRIYAKQAPDKLINSLARELVQDWESEMEMLQEEIDRNPGTEESRYKANAIAQINRAIENLENADEAEFREIVGEYKGYELYRALTGEQMADEAGRRSRYDRKKRKSRKPFEYFDEDYAIYLYTFNPFSISKQNIAQEKQSLLKGTPKGSVADLMVSDSMSWLGKHLGQGWWQSKDSEDRSPVFNAAMQKQAYFNEGTYESTSSLSEYGKLESAEKQLVDKLLFGFDEKPYATQGITVEPFKEKDGKLSLNEEFYKQYRTWATKTFGGESAVVDATVDIRRGLDQDFTALWNLMSGNRDLFKADAFNELNERRKITNYIPHTRNGDFVVAGYIEDSEGNKIKVVDKAVDLSWIPNLFGMREKFFKNNISKKIISELQNDPTIKGMGNVQWAIENREHIPYHVMNQPMLAKALSEIVESAATKMDPKTGNILRKIMPAAVVDAIRETGMWTHLAKRRGVYGYEMENLGKILYDYKIGLYANLSKMRVSQDFTNALQNIDTRKKQTLEWADQLVEDIMAPRSMADSIGSFVRAYSFAKYIGAAIKAPAINISSMATHALPRLVVEVGGTKALAYLSKANSDYTAFQMGRFKHLTTEEIKVLTELQKDGATQAQLMAEVKRSVGRASETMKVIGSMYDVIGLPMKVTEENIRGSMALAAFRAARDGQVRSARSLKLYELKKGEKVDASDEVKYQYLKAFAEELTYDAFSVFGKVNRPGIMRTGRIGKVASGAYTFRHFTHHTIGLIRWMGKQGVNGNKDAYTGMAIGTLAQIALAGMAGVFGQELWRKLYREWLPENAKIMGDDPLAWTKKHAGDWLAYGLPSVLGVNIGQSYGVEMPDGIEDVVGVPYSLVKDFYYGAKAAKTKDYLRAAEMTVPIKAVRDILAAYRKKTQGFTTYSGQPIAEPGTGEQMKLTKKEFYQSLAGFQPIRLQRARDVATIVDSMEKLREDKLTTVADKYGVASSKGDYKGMEEALDEIIEWNDYWSKKEKFQYMIKPKDAFTRRLRPERRAKQLRPIESEVGSAMGF